MAGVPASRTSPSRVYFNGKYIGLYTLVEQVDAGFIKDKFSSNKGVLVKKSGLDSIPYKIKLGSGQIDDIVHMNARITSIPVDVLDTEIGQYLDVDRFLSLMAVEVLIQARDDILDADKDYYIYRERTDGALSIIPWDLNICFYLREDQPGYKIIPERNGQIAFKHLLKNEKLRRLYFNKLCQILRNNYTEERLLTLIDRYEKLIREAVAEDPFVSTTEQIRDVKRIIKARIQSVSGQLEEEGVRCDLAPLEKGQLVINEFVASADSLGDNPDPAGDYPDWIELYNAGRRPVDLSEYYLSVDKDFLKQWRFPRGTSIGPHQYRIIWADREPTEEGLHAIFKLAKSGGQLLLTNSLDQYIDSVSYTAQQTNISYARIPNGSGPFVKAFPTPGKYNEKPLSDRGLNVPSPSIRISPNPVLSGQKLFLYAAGMKKREALPYEIVDMNGTSFYIQGGISLNNGERTALALPALKPGMYMLVLHHPEAPLRKFFIVQ